MIVAAGARRRGGRVGTWLFEGGSVVARFTIFYDFLRHAVKNYDTQ